MRNNIIFIVVAFLSFAVFSSCEKENVDMRDFKDITFEERPLTDCSTSTGPVRDIVAYKLLGVSYKWEVSFLSPTYYMIRPDFPGAGFTYNDYLAKNLCSGTHGAYMNLMEGKTEVIIASRDISRNEKASADELGVELETAPLAIDALVFIVSPKNPVKNLTSDQVRKIYTGEITNWKEVGGVDHAITPYVRDADSGSQEKMETMVMAGLKMIDGLPETIGGAMLSPYYSIEEDEYGIGYTPFYYCTTMVRDLIIQQVKETRPGRLVEMSIHYADGMECAEGDSLTNLFKMELWPTVVFDMNYEQKTSSLSTAVLSAMVDTALSNACSVCGIKAYSKLDGSSLSANICITSPEDGDFVLQVAITEDEIIAQQAGRGGGYHHNNVLRTIPVTVKLGLKKNREESFLFDYFISENRSPENTYIIVSVMATGDGRNIMNNAIKFAAGSDVEYVFED